MFRASRDKRGSSLITYTLILPLFVLLLFGTFEAFRLMSIRHSLHLGLYRAARYISQHRYQYAAARGIVKAELENNTWLMSTNPDGVQVMIYPPDPSTLQPGDRIVLQASLPVHVGDLGFFSLFGLGAPVQITVQDKAVTFADFPASQEWEPLEEGEAY